MCLWLLPWPWRLGLICRHIALARPNLLQCRAIAWGFDGQAFGGSTFKTDFSFFSLAAMGEQLI